MSLKFKNLRWIFSILFSSLFISSCLPYSGVYPYNSGSSYHSSQYKVLCNCGGSENYITGIGSNQQSAENNAQAKCSVTGASIRNCRQSTARAN